MLGVCSDGKLCPVTALESYLKVKGTEEGTLFHHLEGGLLDW